MCIEGIANVVEKGGTTEFLCRDQLLQVEQQALSQPAKGFDFFGYRFMWGAAT
jgi:hypothetical protein